MNYNEICLLNDSFPPLIDGVANTVTNYARILQENGKGVCVVTPDNPDADDSRFSYPVYRYKSLDLRDRIGYTAGNPFDLHTQVQLKKREISLLHSHCPVMSNTMARSLRHSMDVPFILTYHTKFDIDIKNILKLRLLRAEALRALVDSVSSCDELWVVSKGAGENIKSLGYEGDYIIMKNGVDMPKKHLSQAETEQYIKGYNLPGDVPVFLFVGRLMWYKGIRLIIDALAALKYHGYDFRMVFVGEGGDEAEIKSYVSSHLLFDKVIFTEAVRDRETLAAWYSRADLLLFPSTFDTNGLVVREAAACSLASVLVENSCAAEGIENGVDGLLIQENAASLAVCLSTIINHRDAMHEIGKRASDRIYLSWEDSVLKAMERYEIVIDNYRSGRYRKKRDLTEEFFTLSGGLLDLIYDLEEHHAHIEERLNHLHMRR